MKSKCRGNLKTVGQVVVLDNARKDNGIEKKARCKKLGNLFYEIYHSAGTSI